MSSRFDSKALLKLSSDELIAARDRLTAVLDGRARQSELFPAPPPPVVTLPAVPISDGSLAPAVLAPTTVALYQQCSAKWYYRKVLQLPETRTGALVIGSAVHDAIAASMREKMHTLNDQPVAQVQENFRAAVEQLLAAGPVDLEDETPAELVATGEVLLRVYMEQAAPSIQPAAVELPVEGVIGGVPVHGYVDLLDVNGDVIDTKTKSKKPTAVDADHRLQISTYSLLAPGASGRGRRDVLTKTKTVGHYQQTFTVTPADQMYAERLYSITRDQMASGIIAPNRANNMCSRKYCSFADRCVSDFGGVVR